METKLINGLSQVQSKYDAFFIDLWGVLRNGIQLYPGAIEVLKNIMGNGVKVKTPNLIFFLFANLLVLLKTF